MVVSFLLFSPILNSCLHPFIPPKLLQDRSIFPRADQRAASLRLALNVLRMIYDDFDAVAARLANSGVCVCVVG